MLRSSFEFMLGKEKHIHLFFAPLVQRFGVEFFRFVTGGVPFLTVLKNKTNSFFYKEFKCQEESFSKMAQKTSFLALALKQIAS